MSLRQPSLSDKENFEAIADMRSFEQRITSYRGDDPLDLWIKYVTQATEVNKENGNTSELIKLLNRATSTFVNDPRYKNDERYLRLWIMLADLASDPSSIFNILESRGICTNNALLYEGWASILEKRKCYEMVDAVLKRGIERKAAPERLQKFRTELISKRTATDKPETKDPKAFQVYADENKRPNAAAASSSSMTTRQPLAPLSVSLPLATPVAPAATLRYAAPQTPSFAVPATPNAGDTTEAGPRRPEKPGYNRSLLFVKGQEISFEEARAAMHLQKKRAPSPGIRSALRELDSESESEESGLESAPTMTINTRTALAEVAAMWNSPLPVSRPVVASTPQMAPATTSRPVPPAPNFDAVAARNAPSMIPMTPTAPAQHTAAPTAPAAREPLAPLSTPQRPAIYCDPAPSKGLSTPQQAPLLTAFKDPYPPRVLCTPQQAIPPTAEFIRTPLSSLPAALAPSSTPAAKRPVDAPVVEAAVEPKKRLNEGEGEKRKAGTFLSVSSTPSRTTPATTAATPRAPLAEISHAATALPVSVPAPVPPAPTQARACTSPSPAAGQVFIPFLPENIDRYLSSVMPLLTADPSFSVSQSVAPVATFESESYIDLKNLSLGIHCKLSSSPFSSVYRVWKQNDTTEEDAISSYALKPYPWPWEFYIIREIHKRLPTDYARRHFVYALSLDVYSDKAFLLMSSTETPSMQQVIEYYGRSNKSMEEPLVMYYAIELLRVVEELHSINIIHGALKSSNVLLLHQQGSKFDHWTPEGWPHRGVILCDFSHSIDLQLLKTQGQDQTFFGSPKDHGLSRVGFCPEMQTGKPWAHQIDYCGIAEVIFYLLYKEPLQYSLQNGRWLPKQPSVSKVQEPALWETFFSTLLNADRPNLSELRGAFEQHLAANATKSRSIKPALLKLTVAIHEALPNLQ